MIPEEFVDLQHMLHDLVLCDVLPKQIQPVNKATKVIMLSLSCSMVCASYTKAFEDTSISLQASAVLEVEPVHLASTKKLPASHVTEVAMTGYSNHPAAW